MAEGERVERSQGSRPGIRVQAGPVPVPAPFQRWVDDSNVRRCDPDLRLPTGHLVTRSTHRVDLLLGTDEAHARILLKQMDMLTQLGLWLQVLLLLLIGHRFHLRPMMTREVSHLDAARKVKDSNPQV